MSRCFVELHSYVTFNVPENRVFLPCHSAMIRLVSVLVLMKLMTMVVMISAMHLIDQMA
jgi:hypothetical protein